MKYFLSQVPVRSTFHEIQLFMVPCRSDDNGSPGIGSHGVDVKIMKDRKIVESLEDVRRPQLIRLNGTQPGERYIIRVMDAASNRRGRSDNGENDIITAASGRNRLSSDGYGSSAVVEVSKDDVFNSLCHLN